jgi:hypothetical protein
MIRPLLRILRRAHTQPVIDEPQTAIGPSLNRCSRASVAIAGAPIPPDSNLPDSNLPDSNLPDSPPVATIQPATISPRTIHPVAITPATIRPATNHPVAAPPDMARRTENRQTADGGSRSTPSIANTSGRHHEVVGARGCSRRHQIPHQPLPPAPRRGRPHPMRLTNSTTARSRHRSPPGRTTRDSRHPPEAPRTR